MANFLKELVVQDFRSIRGSISVPLDAPVVLIHGKNGVGKTSLLSAIELALTGDVASLRKIDAGVLSYLTHKESTGGARVSLQLEANAAPEVFNIAGGTITGNALLPADEAHFFNERCYLAQSMLSKLLEIYQHQEKKAADSALRNL